LTAYIEAGRPLDEIDRRLLEVFATNIAINLNNVELFDQLHEQAYQDPLLHIPNRMAFMKAVGEALATRPLTTSVAIVDIDHFSHLNDALGYRYGDTLLKAVALLLIARLPAGTLVARMAADTFGVLGENQTITPQTLLPLFRAPFVAEGTEQRLSVTIGLARLFEVDGNASDVIKSANIALNMAKHHRRGEGLYFTRRMELETRARMRLLRELRAAFEQEQLHLVYQPQVCLRSRRLIGVEALLRWNNSEDRQIPPGHFIALAESSGLIVALGKWVLRTACHDLQRLIADGAKGFDDLRMSVNVSVVQFRHPGFLDSIDEVIRESGIDPRRLELEITETVAMLDANFMLATLNRLKRRGIAISIDDFGTGFSSLSYLERLDVDRLKIDQSFVNQMMLSESSLRIVETVIQLGHSLQLQVTAEGVEEEAQAAVLERLGCHAGQGFLFARPMAFEQLRALLKTTASTESPGAAENA
jgi:diguanylate cyclase (GGDEF)-like protein